MFTFDIIRYIMLYIDSSTLNIFIQYFFIFLVIIMSNSTFFFDIDGTLATYQKPVSHQLREKLLYLKIKGHKIFLCTGRGYSDLPPNLLSIGFNGIICSTGAYLRIQDKVIWDCPFPRPLLLELYNYLRELKISSYFEGSSFIYRAEQGESLEKQFPAIDQLLQQPPSRMDAIYSVTFHLKQAEELPAITQWARAHHLNLFMQTKLHGDILMKECNKAIGIKKMLEYLHLTDWPSFGFGDSPNDIDMFRTVNTSIAMGHAPTEVKEAASYITGTFEEDGVFEFLEKFE